MSARGRELARLIKKMWRSPERGALVLKVFRNGLSFARAQSQQRDSERPFNRYEYSTTMAPQVGDTILLVNGQGPKARYNWQEATVTELVPKSSWMKVELTNGTKL